MASALAAGALALGGAASVLAQQPTPTGTAAPPAATPTPTPQGGGPTPPNRFYGTATLNGMPAPEGTAVTASVGTTVCGRGTMSGGMYTVDVNSSFTQPGCGRDGGMITFMVGTGRATQTGTFATGAFTSLNLTAQTPTPTPAPTTPRPPTAAPTTPRPPTAAPTTPRPPTPAPTAATPPRTPTAAPTAQRPAAAPALPRTGAASSDTQAPLWLALAAIAMLGAGTVVIARRRR